MMRLLFSILVLTLATLAASPAMAQKIKDSVDYALDDGVMSKEEMEMEAQDMYTQCAQNAYQRKYFRCDCLAGAFLQQREKLGPTVMQHEIHKIITNSAQVDASCVNVEQMAAEVYTKCMALARNDFRTELSPDNGAYCTCAANKAANDFKKTPRMTMPYIEKVRINAYTYCRDPANLPPVPPTLPAGALPPPKSGN